MRPSVPARLAGIALLLVPFLPLTAVFGEIVGGRDLAGPGEWLLGVFIFGSVAWLVASALPTRADDVLMTLPRAAAALRERTYVSITLLLLAALLAVTSAVVFQHRPLSIDSIVQLFQARIFAAGALAAPAPPEPAFFLTQHMLVDGGRWYSQYPPGHAALLALGAAVGAAWVVPVVLTLGTAVLLWLFARRAYGGVEGRLLLFLLLVSPFFWIMGASHMNHVSSLFFLAAFLLLFTGWEASGRVGTAVAAGLCLGLAALSRPVDALATGLAFGVFAVPMVIRRRRWRGAAAAVAGAAAAASLYLLHNALTTGDPLLPGYVKLWGASHGLGFHESPWGDLHTPLAGLRNELVDLSMLNLFLFEWPVPALLPVGLLFAAGWANRAWDRRLLVAALAIPAAYFFYWHRDGYLGPRFLYGSLAFILPLTARALPALLRRLRGRTIGLGGLLRADTGRVALWLLALSLGYSVAYGIPGRFAAQASTLDSMRLHLVERAREAGIEGGVLFVGVSWGNRLLATAQGLGVPASLAQKAYRRTDHCELDALLERALSDRWPPEAVARTLERMIAEAPPLVQPVLNGDPSLRLRPGVVLPPACADEILYDRRGYTIYAPHLLANRPRLDGGFIVARDLRERNTRLLDALSRRPAWVYHGGEFHRLR